MKLTEDGRVLVPAGEYILGDPCYSFDDHDKRMELLNSCRFFSNPIGTVLGGNVVAFGTAHGDGMYYDEDEFMYGVDAGLIGLVPVSIAQLNDGEYPSYTQRVTFLEDALCWDDGGVLHFGKYVIDTVCEDDDEDDEE